MDADSLLDDLARRYGVPRAFGRKLRPLVARALTSSPDAKQRILDMIDRSFAQESLRMDEQPTDRERVRELSETDREVLRTVAEILHQWKPPGGLGNTG
ncbi:MAG: hypothetical protein WD226_08710 [Planctomycetota bacterium]